MKTGVEPRQLLAVPQAAHRDAHRKTPLAQFRFEKLSIRSARKKDDRINAVEARHERGKHAVGPSAPFLAAHRFQGLFVGPDFFFRMNQAVLRRQDAPRAARRLHTGPRLSEPVGGVEVHRRRVPRPFGLHAGDQKQPAAVTVFQQSSSLLAEARHPPSAAPGAAWIAFVMASGLSRRELRVSQRASDDVSVEHGPHYPSRRRGAGLERAGRRPSRDRLWGAGLRAGRCVSVVSPATPRDAFRGVTGDTTESSARES